MLVATLRATGRLTALSLAADTVPDMSDWDAVTRQHVVDAAKEHDRLGREEFLAQYGRGASRKYLLVLNERDYDSKAIAAAAYERATEQPVPTNFSGGVTPGAAVARLRHLGFEIRDLHPTDGGSGDDA